MGTHEGWKNYETWNVALWLDNEEPSYRECTDMAERLARQHFDESTDQPDTDAATSEMAAWLKEYVEAAMPELAPSCFSDLLNAAMGEVDWHEIAEHYLGEQFLQLAKEVNAAGNEA